MAAPLASGADMQVVGHARRRRFSNADKRRILAAADRCTQPGEIGALTRRDGVYCCSLSTWRRQCEAADLIALAPQKRGQRKTRIAPRPCTSRNSRATTKACRAGSTKPCW